MTDTTIRECSVVPQLWARHASYPSQVQEKLTDLSFVTEKSLIGKLYKLMWQRQEEAPDGMHDAEALALAAAKDQALEREKHGNAICLPAHLHSQIKGVVMPS